MSIFKDNARRFIESGISVVPCTGKSAIGKWKKWQSELPPDNQISAWESAYPDANIGVICGPISGIVVLDIDDEAQLDKLPRSPMCFSSQPGKRESRVFRENGELTQHYQGVDVLGLGALVIVPPSIHPSGRPYKAISWCDWDDLPTLPDGWSTSLKPKEAPEWSQVAGIGQGRWVTLSRLAYARACMGDTTEEISKTLLDHQCAAWFHDKDEPHQGHRPEKEATKMAKSAIDKATKKGERLNGTTLVVDIPSKPAPVMPSTTNIMPAPVMPSTTDIMRASGYEYPPLPESGFIRELYEAIMADSRGSIPAIAYGTALATCAALVQGRFSVLTPQGILGLQLYVLTIAPTGIGKTFSQRIPKMIVPPNLMGAGKYDSSQALQDGFLKQRFRFDMGDEIDSMLSAMDDGSAYQKALCGLYCALYSAHPEEEITLTKSIRGQSAGQKFNIWGPALTVLGSTTNAAITSNASLHLMKKGFFPRFLIFAQRRMSRTTPPNNGLIPNSVFDWANWVTGFVAPMPIGEQNLISPDNFRYMTRCLEFEDTTYYQRLDDAEQEWLIEAEAKNTHTPTEIMMRTRRLEISAKLAAILTLSEQPADMPLSGTVVTASVGDRHVLDLKIPSRNFDLALEIFDYSLRTNGTLLEDMSMENERDKKMQQVFNAIAKYVRKDGPRKGYCLRADFTKHTRHIAARDKIELLAELKEMGAIDWATKRFDGERDLALCYWLVRDKI